MRTRYCGHRTQRKRDLCDPFHKRTHVRRLQLNADMTLLRLVPIHVHAVLETLLAPVLIVAPFALGFEPASMIAAVFLGVLLMGTALATGASLAGTARDAGLRVSAH